MQLGQAKGTAGLVWAGQQAHGYSESEAQSVLVWGLGESLGRLGSLIDVGLGLGNPWAVQGPWLTLFWGLRAHHA